MKRIAILYSNSQSNLHVINELKSSRNDLFLVEEKQSARSHLFLILRRKRDHVGSKIGRILFLGFFFAQLKLRIEPLLAMSLNLNEISANLQTRNVNDPAIARAVVDFCPDVVVTLGTNILRAPWLGLNFPLLNVHVGALPTYRGRFCWLWPILERRFDRWGVTVHSISKHADAGRIVTVLTEDPRATTDLSLAELLARISVLAATALNTALASSVTIDRSESLISKHYLEPRMSDFLIGRRPI